MFIFQLPFTGPFALRVKFKKNITNSSIIARWNAVDDYLPTTYTLTWTSERDDTQVATLIEQTSYTITGLTLDTVYTITVSAANRCGNGPEFRTSISFLTGTTFTVCKLVITYVVLLYVCKL